MRDIPVGNGSFLVNFDAAYQIRDIYFPYVGQENHTEGFPFRFGLWSDGEFSWVFEDGWTRSLRYLPETLVTDVRLENGEFGIRLICHDAVATHDNIFLRRIVVENQKDTARKVRVFLHQDFRIYENKVGDAAFYDPESLSLIHYKKHRYFLINTLPHFDFFTTGRKAFRDLEGTWRDAEDGELHTSAKTEGSVDSTIQVNLDLEAGGQAEFFYWIAAGKSHEEVSALNTEILRTTPVKCLDFTENYWKAWVNKHEIDFRDLSEEVVAAYKRSLLVVRTQVDNSGSILAANDSDVTERATDHYSYLWTRDGAFVAHALDLAGYPYLTRNFFRFCSEIVHNEGYFLQKYNADGTVASGWHAAWDAEGKQELLPIQEDETALVLWSLWHHFSKYREVEFSHRMYRSIVTGCADFLCSYIDEDTGLPKPSWNLWEDRWGIHTYTCATVVAGLRAASRFAELFGETERAAAYQAAADSITRAIREHLYSAEHGRFVRALEKGERGYEPDPTVDASLFGLFFFEVFEQNDEHVINTMQAVERRLWGPGKIGGIARYEEDTYMRRAGAPPNPWFVCTLWLAKYRIAVAESEDDLSGVKELLEWAADRALESGVLAEQIDPETGKAVSVSPLTWSHSTFVAVVALYLEKCSELEAEPKIRH